MSNISTVKWGGMTSEQKAFQANKDANDAQNDIHARFFNIETSLDNLKDGLDLHANMFGVSSTETHQQFEVLEARYLERIKELSNCINSIRTDYKTLSDVSTSNYNNITSSVVYKKDWMNLISVLTERNDSLEKQLAIQRQEFLALNAKTSHDFNVKLAALRKEFLEKPSEIEDLKTSFKDQLELVSLNGTNSQLRSSNNEKHVQLIDKKIENIYQLIKQLELRS